MDPSGQTILVTGATSGHGRRVAEELRARGATVLVHGRDPAKVGEMGGEGYVADLASLADVRRLAEEVRARHERLDVLVNNAGVIVPERRLSADGHELTFAVNHLSHFLLTRELLPLVRRRIVHVASAAQERIDFADPMLERGYSAMRAYSQSKLAQVMFAFELAEHQQVASTVLHPATLMDTDMVRQAFGSAMTSVDQGAAATLRLIADPAIGVTGRYFDGTREARAHRQAYDPAARRRLWELSESLADA